MAEAIETAAAGAAATGGDIGPGTGDVQGTDAAQAVLDSWDGRDRATLMDRFIEATGTEGDDGLMAGDGDGDGGPDGGTADERPAPDDGPGPEDGGPDDGGDVPDERSRAAAGPSAAKDRVVQRLTRAEARIVELERENRELQARRQRAPDDGDYIDVIRARAAARLGCDPDDPRVMKELEHAGGMIVAELAGDIDDPEIRDRRRERAEQRNQRQIQAQIDELRREREEYRQQALRSQKIAVVAQELDLIAPAASHPYLHAAEGDALPARIVEGIDELMRNGWRITTDAEARDAIELICERAEAYHRGVYERLSAAGNRGPAGGNRADRPISGIGTTDDRSGGAQKDGRQEHRGMPKDMGDAGRRGTRTVSASGMSGGRTPPAERSKVDSDGRRIDPIDEAARAWAAADREEQNRARRRR